eukprot:CCRYP_003749-RA/>CCRYP_003749-RA protein AED:0.13 eAED:-0.00 QI:0/0/0/1/0/0.33/3/0/1355
MFTDSIIHLHFRLYDIPWIKHHLSTTRPASRPIRLRLLHYIGCLLPFGSLLLPVASSRPTFVLHQLSSYPQLPSALVYDSAQILWAPIGWRARRHFTRITQKHETVLAKMINGSQLGLSASEPLSLSFPERPPHFVDSFNPALAGINLLLTERFNRILTLSPPLQQSVSIDIIGASPNLQSFPVLLESAYTSSPTLTTPPLIVDTGASCCITPCKDDFVSYAPSAAKIRDLSGINTVAGEGLLCWRVLDHQGREHAIELKGYHIPNASVRLLSPQAMFQSLGGHGEQDISKYSINLPAPHCFWTRCFSFHASDRDIWARSILAASNQNLSLAQKELLLWHHRLSHAGLSTIQNISRQRQTLTPSSTDELVRLRDGPILPCTYNIPSTSCDHLLCAACEISKATRRAPTIRSSRNQAPRQMVLKEDHVKPGDCVSCDHFISPVPGRITFPSGHSSSRNGFTCGTIYVDHCSTFIYIHHQLTTAASDTIRGKMLLEAEAADVGVTIRQFHSDNGVFSSNAFREHCARLGQTLRFSGVGAHHQNGVAERAIQTVTNMARANMLHATLHWPERSFIDLWPLAMNYAVWVYNKLPQHGAGLSPEELFSGIKCSRSNLPRAHVFGCPVYVLDPRLQDGKKIPKWESRARQGIFVGFSPHHSTSVPLILNPRTQHISPQFHVIFDDAFTTVPSLTSESERDHRFEQLFSTSRECYIDPSDIAPNSELLDDHWLSPSDLATRNLQRQEALARSTPCLGSPTPSQSEGVPPNHTVPPPSTPLPVPMASEKDLPPPLPNPPVPEGVPVTTNPPPSPPTTDNMPTELHPIPPFGDTPSVSATNPQRYPSRHRSGTWKDGPALDRKYTQGQWKTGFSSLLTLPQYALASASSWAQPPPAIANLGAHRTRRHSTTRIRHGQLSELSLLQHDWQGLGPSQYNNFHSTFSSYLQPDLSDDLASFTITDVQPHLLTASPADDTSDSPTYSQAIHSPHAEKWWEAMETELTTLESDLQAWELVPREPWMHVLPSTWAFRLKRFPNGLAKKFKARFCIRGDMQIEGTAEGFLGVDIVRSPSSTSPQITLLQTGLTKRIIEAVGLCSSLSTPINTPAETSPLPKDADGQPASGSFNYAAVVGMLLYLSGHSRPDIAFAVHQCARYTFKPSRRHELAPIRIGRYLKGTMDKGLIMTPSPEPRIDCYPDADFAGLYGHEDARDPHCARSRTGYVILAFGCPVLWRSRLQTEIALSTMEAEYVALSTACKDLLPLVSLIRELSDAVGLDATFVSNIHCKVHEDNVGALTLGRLEPRRMTPRSKHYAIKYHWFRDKVADPSQRITLVKIDTKNQLGDLFTKGLAHTSFVHLRRLLMGW